MDFRLVYNVNYESHGKESPKTNQGYKSKNKRLPTNQEGLGKKLESKELNWIWSERKIVSDSDQN